MFSFMEVEQQAADRHGGLEGLLRQIPLPLPLPDLIAIPDERYLSELSKIIFQVGFNWSLIEKKWPAFETAFFEFKLEACSYLSDEQLEALLSSGKLIKNWPKIRAIRDNATWLQHIRSEHGGVGLYLHQLSNTSYCHALIQLQKQGSRVGAKTAQLWLRRMGFDALILSADVVTALQRFGVLIKPPSSQKDWRELQQRLDCWQQETGKGLTYISKMLAFSIGPKS